MRLTKRQFLRLANFLNSIDVATGPWESLIFSQPRSGVEGGDLRIQTPIGEDPYQMWVITPTGEMTRL